jgi:hypothetical protein
MKNIFDVLRQKEADLQRIQREVEALRIATSLLADDDNVGAELPRMRVAAAATPASLRTDTEILLSAPSRQFP